MRSHILGRIELDQQRLKKDLEYLATVPTREEEYDEFSNGFWKNIPLYNASAGSEDGLYRDLQGSPARPTGHAKHVPYLDEIISMVYNTGQLQMARTRNLKNAIVLPHRDFVELDRELDQYFRTFMVLEDNPLAFHSDEDTVFHMRPGEIWFLDAAAVHSAVNFGEFGRQSLCVDLAFEGAFDEQDAFADTSVLAADLSPDVPERKPFTKELEEGILALSGVTGRENFRDVLFLLSKVHYSYNVHPSETFEWLVAISKAVGDDAMVEKADRVRDFLIGTRELGERFSLARW